MGSVAEGEHEAGYEGGEVAPFEDDGEDETSGAEEVVGFEGVGEDAEDEEEVALTIILVFGNEKFGNIPTNANQAKIMLMVW